MTVDLRTGLSVDEYLDRSFDPECELLGGETRPKPWGTGTHFRVQKRLTRLLEKFYGERRVQFELGMIIGQDILIPDVTVLASHSPRMHRDVLNEPPLLCVEILSPSQRFGEMLAKCERYREFGVPFCWVLDPVGHKAWEYHLKQPEAVEQSQRKLAPRLNQACEITEMFAEPCALLLREIFEF